MAAAALYRSPYVHKVSGAWNAVRGYAEDDVRAIQRGCNIIGDLQGHLPASGPRERWNATIGLPDTMIEQIANLAPVRYVFPSLRRCTTMPSNAAAA